MRTSKRLIQDCLKANVLVVELKSEALKERHWKQLMKRMGKIKDKLIHLKYSNKLINYQLIGVSWMLSELTLGSVWDSNLLNYE